MVLVPRADAARRATGPVETRRSYIQPSEIIGSPKVDVAQAAQLDKDNGKNGTKAVRLINMILPPRKKDI